jgi:hypothetical protein
VVDIAKTITVPFGNLSRLLYVWVSYTDNTYNSLNKQPQGTVIVLVIPITLTIVKIQQNGTAIVLVIPTTLTII